MARDPAEFLADPRFNRRLDLPAVAVGPTEQPFHVKYADFGYQNEEHPEEEKVLLFFVPLFSSRIPIVSKDNLAKRHKIRVVCMDRPGFGGCTEVPVQYRIQVCTALTLALLKHLNIKHVSIATQSGGTIYAMDFLLRHPEILDPKRPFAFLGAPWIHPSRTVSLTMGVTDMLPAAAIGTLDKLATLTQSYMLPISGLSTGVVSTWSDFFGLSSSKETDPESAFEDAVHDKMFAYVAKEGIQGLSDEALVLMKKGDGLDRWGDWKDYDELVPLLQAALRQAGRRLQIETFFAEKDFMTGNPHTSGPQWFDKCFGEEAASEGAGDVSGSPHPIGYHRRVIPGSDHNSIWKLNLKTMELAFEMMNGASSE